MVIEGVSGDGKVDEGVSPSLRHAYLEELTQWDLGRIRRDPGILRDQANRLTSDIQELAIQHYRQFLDTATCLTRCKTRSHDIDESLGKLCENMSGAAQCMKQFALDRQSQSEQNAMQASLTELYPQILDVLELPYLMESRIAENLYEAALDIRDDAHSLLRRNPDVRVLNLINEAVDRTTDRLLSDLLTALESVVQLPQSLLVIGHIRRIGRFTEPELRVHFLQRRETWLEARLVAESSPDASPLVFLAKFLDLTRVHLFEIVTQYQAVFAEDDNLLQLWVSHRVDDILDKVTTSIESINSGSSLASLLEQAMYCGLSLGSIRVDFRALLFPIFSKRVSSLFAQMMGQAEDSFRRSIAIHTWYIDAATLGKLGIALPKETTIPLPTRLMQFAPLAVLATAIFDVCNQIRECVPLMLLPEIATQLQGVLCNCSTILSTLEERPEDICQAFGDILLPATVAAFSTLTASSAQNNNSSVDIVLILKPLRTAALYSDENTVPRATMSFSDDDGDDDDDDEMDRSRKSSHNAADEHRSIHSASSSSSSRSASLISTPI